MTDLTGQVDGEVPDQLIVRLSGQSWIDRPLLEGERVVLTVCGTVTGLGFKRDRSHQLIRTHTLAVESAAEPIDRLLADVTVFLNRVDDAREGRQQLPFDEADDDNEADDE